MIIKEVKLILRKLFKIKLTNKFYCILYINLRKYGRNFLSKSKRS